MHLLRRFAAFLVPLALACGGDDAAPSNATDAPSTTGPDSDAGETTDASATGTNGDAETGGSTSVADDADSTTAADHADSTTGSDATDSSSDSGSTTGEAITVELDDYVPDAPMQNLPAPLINTSGIAWNDDTDRLWILQNGAGAFFEYAPDDLGTPLRRIELGGIVEADTEGMVYMGGGEVAVAFESGYGVYIADIPDGAVDITVAVKQTLVLAPTPPAGNSGLEGIAYDRLAEVFYAVGEGQAVEVPRRFFRFARPADTTTDLTWQDAGLVVTQPFDADTVLMGADGSFDLAGLTFDARDGNVLLVSHTGGAIVQLDPNGDGTILDTLELPPNQWEGITLRDGGAQLWIVGEANDFQRYDYQPR